MIQVKFLFLIVIFIFIFIGYQKDESIIFGEVINENPLNIIEKNSPRIDSFNNTSYNIELSDFYYKNNDENKSVHTFQLNNQPNVIINTNVFSCELEDMNSERICISLLACNDSKYCPMVETKSNLTIIGKEPIYSFITSDSGIQTKQVKLQPGEYEIIPNDNDVISSNYCNEIVLDGVKFHEFTMGSLITQNKTSILCVNIGDGCYGVIKNGETKICDINKVFIKI
jgi:hypothetical protein